MHATQPNFKTHFTRVHKKTPLVAKEMPPPTRGKRKRVDDQSEACQSKKQCTLSGNPIAPSKFCCLLSEYIVEDMLPLLTVESSAFQKLLSNFCPTGQKVVQIVS